MLTIIGSLLFVICIIMICGFIAKKYMSIFGISSAGKINDHMIKIANVTVDTRLAEITHDGGRYLVLIGKNNMLLLDKKDI